MFSVFSINLIQRVALATKLDTSEIKLSDAVTKFSCEPHVLISDDVPSDIADDILYEYCINPKLRKLVEWITTRIINEVVICSIYTIDVRLRVATGMLNKLNLDSPMSMWIHDSIVKNCEMVFYDVINEELPF